jgi:6-pyruvoyltetrahydropterin/6-carboxytetrahydropterin synthase
MAWELIVKQKFACAHFLEHYQGKCEKMHGHTFELEVHFKADSLQKSGISIDFTEIKQFLHDLVPDHKVLNEVYDFSPSAENLSRHFYHEIARRYPVCAVIVWESENAGARYAEGL